MAITKLQDNNSAVPCEDTDGQKKRLSLLGLLFSLKDFLLKTPLYRSVQERRFFVLTIEKGESTAAIVKGTLQRPSIIRKSAISGEHGAYIKPAELIDVLNAEHNVKTAKFILTVPKEWCIIKTVQLPDAVIDNLDTVLSYDMDNLTPFTNEEVFFDYNIISKENSMVNITLYVLNKQPVNQYLSVLKDNGYVVSAIIPTAYSLTQLCAFTLKGQNYDGIVLIKVKDDKFELNMANNTGILTGTYNFPKDKVEGLVEFLSKRVKGTVKVVVNADDEHYDGIIRAMSFNAVKFDTVKIDELPMGIKERPSHFYSAALGVLTNEYNVHPLNLLTLGKKQKKSPPFVLSIIIGIIITAIYAATLYIPIWKAEQSIEELDRQLKQLKPEIDKIDTLKSKAKKTEEEIIAYNAFIDKEVLHSEVLAELSRITPIDTWLIRLEITDENATMEGYSSNASEFLALVEKSPFFEKAQFTATTVKDPRLQKDRFKIKATIVNIRPNE
ncbi:MAG: PilN domain-containing protein [Candidatus Magnetoovum sp. WYHC-5]|nr:PilN domain-containing protein [Candidatus Magnetoovum sp. WYHC-5]